MNDLEIAAREFLGRSRFAVAGVARKGDTAANAVYRKLRASGRFVVPVNPHAAEVEGDRCYPTVADIPGGVEAVVIATPAAAILPLLGDCVAAGVVQVWIHGAFGGTAVPPEAVTFAREHRLRLIPGACPMMFCEPVDVGHRCMWWIRQVTGRVAQPLA